MKEIRCQASSAVYTYVYQTPSRCGFTSEVAANHLWRLLNDQEPPIMDATRESTTNDVAVAHAKGHNGVQNKKRSAAAVDIDAGALRDESFGGFTRASDSGPIVALTYSASKKANKARRAVVAGRGTFYGPGAGWDEHRCQTYHCTSAKPVLNIDVQSNVGREGRRSTTHVHSVR